MNIGIIGYGIVGKSVEAGFRDKCELFLNDVEDTPYTKKQLVENCEYIFVGVPTPFDPQTKKVDSSIITGVIEELNRLSGDLAKSPIVIVKSAIVPRVVGQWINDFKRIKIVISPEYLTERSCIHDFVNQKVMVLGGEDGVVQKVNQLYLDWSICNKLCKVGYCDAEEAALIKYMENSFLAMKCIFNNQFKFFYDKYFNTDDDDEFNSLLDVFYLDERMGLFPFKYIVPGPDGDYGYGGKCLPKDVQAIIGEGEIYKAPLNLMKKVSKINDEIRTDRNWEEIDGAFKKN